MLKNEPMGFFNFNDFKKWMDSQKEIKPKTGVQVESKIPLKRLLSRIDVESGDADKIIEDFKNGGTVVSTDGNKFLVEVASGSFIVHKMYLRKI